MVKLKKEKIIKQRGAAGGEISGGEDCKDLVFPALEIIPGTARDQRRHEERALAPGSNSKPSSRAESILSSHVLKLISNGQIINYMALLIRAAGLFSCVLALMLSLCQQGFHGLWLPLASHLCNQQGFSLAPALLNGLG